jgi:hypothetical protein
MPPFIKENLQEEPVIDLRFICDVAVGDLQ